MVAKTASTIEIARSPAQVRAVFLEFQKFHEWAQGSIKSVEAASPNGTLNVGDNLKLTFPGMGTWKAKVSANSPSEFKWYNKYPGILWAEHTFRFEPSKITPGHTTFVNSEVFGGTLTSLATMFGADGEDRDSLVRVWSYLTQVDGFKFPEEPMFNSTKLKDFSHGILGNKPLMSATQKDLVVRLRVIFEAACNNHPDWASPELKSDFYASVARSTRRSALIGKNIRLVMNTYTDALKRAAKNGQVRTNIKCAPAVVAVLSWIAIIENTELSMIIPGKMDKKNHQLIPPPPKRTLDDCKAQTGASKMTTFEQISKISKKGVHGPNAELKSAKEPNDKPLHPTTTSLLTEVKLPPPVLRLTSHLETLEQVKAERDELKQKLDKITNDLQAHTELATKFKEDSDKKLEQAKKEEEDLKQKIERITKDGADVKLRLNRETQAHNVRKKRILKCREILRGTEDKNL
ncbi:hypothetical protein F5Y16DRAFT_401303 [Xylariaceae sp. FL0255]|nr:hypothetical protein F5Y16DRAFT_401303 [Xylariaceae sp. FL0255]